jgi:hypothetical protein
MRQREALDILQDIEVDEYMTKVLVEAVSSLSRPLLEQELMIVWELSCPLPVLC